MDVVALMPAYKGDERMISSIEALQAVGFEDIVVVNDGSGKAYDEYYASAESLGAVVLNHAVNLGKGRGLRTGFNHILLNYPNAAGIVVCDCDGQLDARDALQTAQFIKEYPGHLILSCREFFKSRVPLPNLMGNTITRGVFVLLCGLAFKDTQGGVRGYPMDVAAKLMEAYGERFEFESTMLYELRRKNIPYVQFPIRAIYAKEQSSHYNKVVDSYKIYMALLRYARLPIFSGLVATLLAFVCRGFPMQPLCQAMCVLAGWLITSFFMPDSSLWKWLGAVVLGTAVGFGAALLCVDVLGLQPMQAWFLAMAVNLPLNYTLWQRVFYGRRPARITLRPSAGQDGPGESGEE